MADLIRDVRKDLAAPKMPFVIGVLGVGGPIGEDYSPRYKVTHQNFRDAMAAPASMVEFKDNVAAVRTELYWDQPLAAIEAKRGQVNNLARQLRSKAKGSPNEEGKMSPAEQKKYVEEYRANLISSEEDDVESCIQWWLSLPRLCQDHGPDGKAFAESLLEMEKN